MQLLTEWRLVKLSPPYKTMVADSQKRNAEDYVRKRKRDDAIRDFKKGQRESMLANDERKPSKLVRLYADGSLEKAMHAAKSEYGRGKHRGLAALMIPDI